MINVANITWFLVVSRRFLRRPATTAVLTVIAIFTLPMLPVAAQSLIDPSSNIQALAQGFFPTAQAWAFRLYMILLGFELFAFAVQAILFKDNIGEFIGGAALKILVGGVFLWFAANANTFFFAIINGFKAAGQQAGGSSDTTPFALVASGLTAGALFLAASDVARLSDSTYASSAGNVCTSPGVCLIGTSQILATGHNLFEMVAQGLGLMIMLAFTAIFIQVILTTIESYIVIFAGVFYIGFAGSRFTMPYSQGYFSYVINVGTKLFVIYFIAGALQSFILPLITSAGTALVAACCIPGGLGVGVGIAAAAYGALEAVIAASLVWGIPGFAASFLSGSSSASATAVMSQVAGSMTGASMLMNGMRAGRNAQNHGGGPQATNSPTSAMPMPSPSPVGMTSAKVSDNMFQTAATAQGNTGDRTGLDQDAVAGSSTFKEGAWSPTAAAIGGSGNGSRAALDQDQISGTSTFKEGALQRERPATVSGPDTTIRPPQSLSDAPAPYALSGPTQNGSAAFGDDAYQGDSSDQDDGSSNFVPLQRGLNGAMLPMQGLGGGGLGNGGAGGGSAPSGNHLPSAEKISEMAGTREGIKQIEEGIRHSDWADLDASQRQAIKDNPELREFAENEARNRIRGHDREMDNANYMMLQGLSMAMPRDNAQPTAVQIRIGNPDR